MNNLCYNCTIETYNTHSDKRRVKKCRNLICPFPTKLLQFQDFYDTFSRNFSYLRRKFGDNSTAREKYDTEFEKIRTKALKMKKGLSEDSPRGRFMNFLSF